MSNYHEIDEAIEIVFKEVNESDEFKRGLKKLIENYLDDSASDNDINEILKLTNIKRRTTNES
jgi:hypothetical protein